MKVDGRCHCGKITYEGIVDPEYVTICHCTDCQMLTGSAYRVSVPVPANTFILHTGRPSIYVKTAESGTKRAHAFCPDCGTPVYSAAIDGPETYSLRLGCLTQRGELHPRRQIWCRSALPWAMDIRDLEQRSQQR